MTQPAISAVAFCPHPPLLLPGIASGAGIETQSLRSACDRAVDRLIETGPAQVVVVGIDGPAVGVGSFAPGLGDAGERKAPLSLLVGDCLLARQRHRQAERQGERKFQPRAVNYVPISPDGTPNAPWPDMTEPTALLVMGDGSARRSLKGPGYLDERAEPFDDAVVAALAKAAPQALADLDLTLAAELLAAGAPAWVATARIVGPRPWQGDVLYADAPYGVMYVVATWLP